MQNRKNLPILHPAFKRVSKLDEVSEEPSDTSSSFETRLKNDRQNVHISNHIGLCNVYMRLLLMYNNQCQLSIYPNDECGTTIHIEIILNTLEEGVKQTS